MRTDHLNPTELADWITTGPASPAARGIRAHLADCDDCRGEAIELSRLVRAGQRATWRVPRVAGTALAVAAVMMLAVYFGPDSTSVSPAIVRSEITETTLTPVAPLGTVRLSDGPVTFSWHPAANAAEYRLTLLDAAGSVLWNQVTTDTVIFLPVEISLARNTSYFWYLDALQSNGESITTGSREFRLGL